MDIQFELNGVRFVWDADKARANKAAHDGISFEQAAQAFFDPFLRLVEATRKGEQRHAVIGMTFDYRLLFVVHAEIEDDFIRIISARGATRGERRFYETAED